MNHAPVEYDLRSHASSAENQTTELPTIMGAATRSAADAHNFPAWIPSTTSRFQIKLSEDAEDKQLNIRDKILSRIKLEDFNPKTEEQFENWVDLAAGQIS